MEAPSDGEEGRETWGRGDSPRFCGERTDSAPGGVDKGRFSKYARLRERMWVGAG